MNRTRILLTALTLTLPITAQQTSQVIATYEKAEVPKSLRELIVIPAPKHQDSDHAKNMLQAMYDKAQKTNPKLTKRDFVLAFHDKAINGDVDAGYYYGAARMAAWGISSGPDKEVEGYIGTAAKANKPEALRDYSILNYLGAGVPENEPAAYTYAQRAADAGLPSGQALAAEFLQAGVGTKQDIPRATELFKKAVDAGDPVAAWNYALILTHETKTHEPEYAAAVPYLQKAAEAADDRALDKLGIMLIYGDGIKVDEALGYKYLEYAATAGNADAEHRLGVSYINGSHGHKQSDEAGTLYLEAASKNGDTDAMIDFGLMTMDGKHGLKQDHDSGFAWVMKAAKAGNPDAAKAMHDRL